MTMERMKMPNLSSLVPRRNPNLHSEIHLLVDETRKSFGESAKKGVGSFGYYLGFFTRLGADRVRTLLASARDANDPKKMFWYLVGIDRKDKNAS